ncbi:wound-induced protein 1 [Ricinus communis]|nr:wound-induced protein 1 [Ricinus communis]|eukprot:XP_015575709.1 wound-induced protein 1 [Ricinus communis]
MMRLLTGADTSLSKISKKTFEFNPEIIRVFGSIVIAEGCDSTRSISWVHAWTVTDGIITQVKEYFNTSLTVTRLGHRDQSEPSDSSPSSSSSSSSSTAEITSVHCPSVWESSLSNRVGKSVPGLVLAI